MNQNQQKFIFKIIFIIILFFSKNILANEAEIIAVGDIMLSRGVDAVSMRVHDYYYPFAKVGAYLQSVPVVFGNLESTITPGPKIAVTQMKLRAEPEVVPFLKQAGFNVLSIANNHIGDFGKQGLSDTINNLRAANINVVGEFDNLNKIQRAVIITENGIKIAFLAYCDSYFVPPKNIAVMNIRQMRKDIQNAKQQADFVVVSMHAGDEYQFQPNARQKAFAHAAIDAGAEIVIGHHPHVIQPVEKYHDKYIFYSLGNFIFDQNKNLAVKTGLMLHIFLNSQGVSKILLIPTRMQNYGQPDFLPERIAKEIVKQFVTLETAAETIYSWDKIAKVFNVQNVFLLKNKQTNFIAENLQTKIINNNLYILQNNQLEILQNKKLLWQSPKSWNIKNFVLADATNTGNTIINLNLWKKGSFGTSKPFWIKANDQKNQNHLFLYRLNTQNKIQPVWGSSALDAPNCQIVFADILANKQNELITLEGSYQDYPKCIGKYLAVWQWSGWGFTNIWRSQKLTVKNPRLGIEQLNNGTTQIIISS